MQGEITTTSSRLSPTRISNRNQGGFKIVYNLSVFDQAEPTYLFFYGFFL
jgi:hypothetical protein